MNNEMDIVMTQWTALRGSFILAKQYKDRLSSHIPSSFIARVLEYEEYLNVDLEERIVKKFSDQYIRVGSGGVMKGLWDFGEAYGIGFRVYLKDIYIKQETIEICEYFNINPYMLDGTGSLLVLVRSGNELVRELRNQGIIARIIGHSTRGNDRLMINKDEVRYIESRIKDEQFKIK